MPGLVDLACAPRPSALLEFFVLQSARFVVCESIDLQQAAYLTSTPTLTLNARDPISRYPVRRDGVFTLTRATDLDSGRVIPLHERLGDWFFLNDRNVGHTPNAPETVVEAVREMHEGSSAAWHDTAEQLAFRTAVTQSAGALAATVPLVADWGADDGFVGDGRLARVQAASSGAWSLEPGARPVSRVLFVMLHPGYVRYFESGIRALAGAGHAVHVAFEISRDKLNESDVAARLATLTPLVTCGPAPDRTESVRDFLARGDRTATRSGQPRRRLTTETAWSSLATTVRLMEDYLRFFEPAFAAATALKARAEKRLPRVYRPFVRAAALGGSWWPPCPGESAGAVGTRDSHEPRD